MFVAVSRESLPQDAPVLSLPGSTHKSLGKSRYGSEAISAWGESHPYSEAAIHQQQWEIPFREYESAT